MITPISRPMTNEPHPRDRGQKCVKPRKSNVAPPQFLTLLGRTRSLITIIAGIEARQREWSWLALPPNRVASGPVLASLWG
jgi:hypothetical protein